MKKVNLKDNIFIIGCNNISELREISFHKNGIINFDDEIVYSGLTSEIKREDVEDYIVANKGAYLLVYRNYSTSHHPWFKTAQESIRSACPEEYCIIYKEK